MDLRAEHEQSLREAPEPNLHRVLDDQTVGESNRIAVDLLSEMPGVLDKIGLMRLPHYTVLRTWFARISTKIWRAFLGERAEKRSGHAAIDSTGFDRDQPSRHYANRTHYRVRALKVTALVDVETLYITDIHSTTSKKHDAKIGPQPRRRPRLRRESLPRRTPRQRHQTADQAQGHEPARSRP